MENNTSLIKQTLIDILLGLIFWVAVYLTLSYIHNSNNNTSNTTNITKPCEQLVTGKRYIIYGEKSDNPFEPQAVATVIINDIKDGYVQYCWDYDYAKPEKFFFYRTCKEFVFAMNNKQ